MIRALPCKRRLITAIETTIGIDHGKGQRKWGLIDIDHREFPFRQPQGALPPSASSSGRNRFSSAAPRGPLCLTWIESYRQIPVAGGPSRPLWRGSRAKAPALGGCCWRGKSTVEHVAIEFHIWHCHLAGLIQNYWLVWCHGWAFVRNFQ